MSKGKKSEDIINKRRGLLVVSLSVIFVLGVLLVLIAGKTFFAGSEIMKWIWWIVWLGILPLLLVLSFRKIIKRNKK